MNREHENILEKLNPADYFTLAMDDEIRRDGLAGSFGFFILELSNPPDIEILQQRVDELAIRFPTVRAALKQIGRRFYWCRRDDPLPLLYQQCCPENTDKDTFLQQIIDRIINLRQMREITAPIDFHLLSGTNRTLFLLRWLHPFCDARGAALILKFLCTADAEQRKRYGLPKTIPLVNLQLAKFPWWQKLGLFWKAKRYIEQLDSLETIQPFPADQPPNRLAYLIQRLNKEQTEQIIQNARQEVGLTGTSLYFIGCLMRALELLQPNQKGAAFCVPYAFNLRKQRALTPVTGNHVCALFAQAPRKLIKDRQRLFTHLKQQNSDVIRRQLDYAFLPLMWAGSWLSLPEYGKTLRLSYGSRQERSSFWFSDIGRLDLSPGDFPGSSIESIFPVCQVTSPPSLAFLSGIYRDRLTLSYNFVEPRVNAEQISRLHHSMLEELLATNR